jgi:hypothetical protein
MKKHADDWAMNVWPNEPNKKSTGSRGGDGESYAGASHLTSRDVRAVRQERALASAWPPSLPSLLELKI